MSNIKRKLRAKLNQLITESTINRIDEWIDKTDVAILTAFRYKFENATANTIKDKEEGELYTKNENRKRNNDLKGRIRVFGYGVTKVYGSYIENYKSDNEREVAEESFFVTNLTNSNSFKDDMALLSELYGQDSFLFKAKGDEDGYLIGTNKADFPGLGNQINVGSFRKNVKAEFMSRLGTKGFAFAPSKDDVQPDTPLTRDMRKVQRISDKLQ